MSVADSTKTSLNCTLIPLKNTAMLIPNSAIAEVILQNHLTDSSNEFPGLAGTTQWNQKPLLIISPELLDAKQNQARFAAKNIIVIIKNPDLSQALTHLGILAQQSPGIIQASAHNLKANTTPPKSIRFALSYVQIDQQTAYIPDIPALFSYIALRFQSPNK